MQNDNKIQVENLTGIKVIAEVKDNQNGIEIDNITSLFKEV